MAQKPTAPKSGVRIGSNAPATKPTAKQAPSRDSSNGRYREIGGVSDSPKGPGTGGTGVKAKVKGG